MTYQTENWTLGSQRPTCPKRYFFTKFHMHHLFLFLVKHKTGTLFGNLSFKFIFYSTFWVLSFCHILFCYIHSFLYLKIAKNLFHVVLSVVRSALQFTWILYKSHNRVWEKGQPEDSKNLYYVVPPSESENNKYKCSARSL